MATVVVVALFRLQQAQLILVPSKYHSCPPPPPPPTKKEKELKRNKKEERGKDEREREREMHLLQYLGRYDAHDREIATSPSTPNKAFWMKPCVCILINCKCPSRYNTVAESPKTCLLVHKFNTLPISFICTSTVATKSCHTHDQVLLWSYIFSHIVPLERMINQWSIR